MYTAQTVAHRAVHGTDIAVVGRVLVVDDDRSFGQFLQALLESRGHAVEWAGSVADGLASLYATRYDLVLIDLRLPDGSGLDLLRDATDEGLLAHSSAIILTGQHFEEPSDITVMHKPLDLEPFLDQMAVIIAATRRRQSSLSVRPSSARRNGSNDSTRRSHDCRIELVLYTSPASEKCQKAIRVIRNVLERYDHAQVRFSICDLSSHAGAAEEDAVAFTPTLVKRGPGPRTWIVGNLDQADLLVDLLEVSGVQRRRE